MTSWFTSKAKKDAPPPPGVGGTKVPSAGGTEESPLLTQPETREKSNAYASREEAEQAAFDSLPEHRHNFQSAMEANLHRHGKGMGIGAFILGFLWMAFVPWVVFAGIGVMFIMLYYHFGYIMWFGGIVYAMICLMMIASGRVSGGASGLKQSVMGSFFLVTLMVAFTCGMMNYKEYMFHYWAAHEGRQYTNVAPDSLAAAHEDGGMIVFSDDATVDITKPIGFKAGGIYCVAPILRAESNADIQYWAAGTDCCRGRDFFTCDDVLQKDARSGVVIRNEMSPLAASNLKYYKHAAQTAVETYGLTQAKDAIFVHWVKDINAFTGELFTNGWVKWTEHVVAYFVFSCIVSVLIQALLITKQVHEQHKEKKKALHADDP